MKPTAPKYNFHDIKELKFGEEIGNSVSHGVPALLILFTLPYFAVQSYVQHGSLFLSVSVCF